MESNAYALPLVDNAEPIYVEMEEGSNDEARTCEVIDTEQNNFEEIKFKRNSEHFNFITDKFPLQKAASLRSIIGVNDSAAKYGLLETQSTSRMHRRRGSKSDTEEETCRPDRIHYNFIPVLHDDNYNQQPKKKRNKRLLLFGTKDLPKAETTLKKMVSGALPDTNLNRFHDDVTHSPFEYIRDCPLSVFDLCADMSLGLHEIEPDVGTAYIGKEISKNLKEEEIKRQECIYELILSEKHYCITLLLMQKLFVEGLQKYLNLGSSLEKMFPRLIDLITIHLELLSNLRQRQKEASVVSTIADILLEQFSNNNAAKLKSVYGEFCSKHRDAIDIYKNYFQNYPRFNYFVRHCQKNTLLKKKGIPECLLTVTQRLTKYTCFIDLLIKTSKDNIQEYDDLRKALSLLKQILFAIDIQVLEKEKEDSKLDIFNRIDANSYTRYKELIFKKSDILKENRRLKFEGCATLVYGREKIQVMVVVLSDVLFFLEETFQKYSFFTPNKAGVFSLKDLMVTKDIRQEFQTICLISHSSYPQMFKLRVRTPKNTQIWIKNISEAIQECQVDGTVLNVGMKDFLRLLTYKEDTEALIKEKKMSCLLRILAYTDIIPQTSPIYRALVGDVDNGSQIGEQVLTTEEELRQISSSIYNTRRHLSKSVSFDGFDNLRHHSFKQKNLQPTGAFSGVICNLDSNVRPCASSLYGRMPYKNYAISGKPPPGNQSASHTGQNIPRAEQQNEVIQLLHNVYSLLYNIPQFMNRIETLIQIVTLREDNKDINNKESQDKLFVEKAVTAVVGDQEAKEVK